MYKYGPAKAKQDVNRTVFASFTIYLRDVNTIPVVKEIKGDCRVIKTVGGD
jgi:hypothetical protein